MLQVLLLELEPLRCWPTFRSKEQARTSRLGAVPDSVLRRPTGLKLLVARACANHASAAAAGVEWERRRTVLSLEVAWSTEYMRGSASICCYAVDASSEWSVPAAEVFSSCNCRSQKCNNRVIKTATALQGCVYAGDRGVDTEHGTNT